MITFNKKPPVVCLCDNPAFFRITTDLPSGTENIVIYIDPYYTTGNVLLGEELMYLAPEGTGEIELSEYLRKGLQATRQFVFPEQGNVSWSARSGLVKEYKIRTNETSGIEVPVTNVEWLEDRYVMRGKIPRWKKQSFYGRWNSFLQWISSDKAFLTFSPSTLITTPTMVQKLYFPVYWAPDAGTHLTLRIRLYFTDGTDDEYTPSQDTAEIGIYEVIEFSVGYSVLGLANLIATSFPGKKLDSYDVTVINVDVAVSQVKTYKMDYTAHEGERQFIFANSLPGYDTFLATGEGQLESEFEYDVVNQQSPGLSELPEKKTAFIKSVDIVKASTGYLSAEMAEYMAEMFESTEVYEIIGTNLYPVIFKNVRIRRKEDNSNLRYFDFEYEYANNQFVEAE